jgi:hypothetical protein
VLDLLPDDGVGRRARRLPLRGARRIGDRRLDRLERDRAAPLDPGGAEVLLTIDGVV